MYVLVYIAVTLQITNYKEMKNEMKLILMNFGVNINHFTHKYLTFLINRAVKF